MSTAFYALSPEESAAFDTDIKYRLQVEQFTSDAIDRGQADEVILFLNEGFSEPTVAENPGVGEFLASLGLGEELVRYVLTFEDSKIQGKLANELRKNRTLTLEQLQQIGEPLRPPKLTPEEVVLFETIKNEPWLISWMQQQLLGYRQEFDSEEEYAQGVIAWIGYLGRIKDWWIAAERPDIRPYDFAGACQAAITWETEIAEDGRDLDYGPGDDQKIIWTDKNTGWTVRNVDSARALKREGFLMQHCVSSYADKVRRGESMIWSVRDTRNHPKITLEVQKKSGGWVVLQIQGYMDKAPWGTEAQVIKRFFEADPSKNWSWIHETTKEQKGGSIINLAIRTVVGTTRWQATDYRREENRPEDITVGEVAAMVDEYARLMGQALKQSGKWLKRSRENRFKKWGLGSFQEVTLSVLFKRDGKDEYGINVKEKVRYTARMNSSGACAEASDIFAVRSKYAPDGIPMSPELVEPIDRLASVLADVDKQDREEFRLWVAQITSVSEQNQREMQCLSSLLPLKRKIKVKDLVKKCPGTFEDDAYVQNYPEHTVDEEWIKHYIITCERNIDAAKKTLGYEHNRTHRDSVTGDIDGAFPGGLNAKNAYQYLLYKLYEKVTERPLGFSAKAKFKTKGK